MVSQIKTCVSHVSRMCLHASPTGSYGSFQHVQFDPFTLSDMCICRGRAPRDQSDYRTASHQSQFQSLVRQTRHHRCTDTDRDTTCICSLMSKVHRSQSASLHPARANNKCTHTHTSHTSHSCIHVLRMCPSRQGNERMKQRDEMR